MTGEWVRLEADTLNSGSKRFAPPGSRKYIWLAVSILLLLPAAHTSQAQTDPPTPTPVPSEGGQVQPCSPGYELGAQSTVIVQNLFRFHSPYQGFNSLKSITETRITDTYTLYLGSRLTRNMEVYVNPEMVRGEGIGGTVGLAGFTNGDIIRNPAIGESPYLARYFARWTVSTGPGIQNVDPAENQSPGPVLPTAWFSALENWPQMTSSMSIAMPTARGLSF